MVGSIGSSEYDDLFFTTLVDSYTSNPRFLRRDWLADEVMERLQEPTCRFLLLTAEPGAGKSTFMAQLARDHPGWPRYFIRRDQREAVNDGGTRGFLEQVGFQLAARYPDAFHTDNVRISLSQTAGSSSGEIIGADIDRLIASPFYSKAVDISQEVEDNRGLVVGLRVRELVTDPNLITIPDLQRMALFGPARALKELGHAGLVIVLIDALDELRYRAPGGTVLEWLIQCPELPDNVRIVITSRPDEQWLATLRSAQESRLLEETIPETGDRITADLTAYARKLAAEPAVQAFLTSSKRTKEQIVADAVDKSGGNLGYLDALGRAVDQASARGDQKLLAALLELKQLPDSLPRLYGHFLNLIWQGVAEQSVIVKEPVTRKQHFVDAWPAVYEPILGVLSVAREPLDENQIRWLGGIAAEKTYVSAAISRLLQFLDHKGTRYRLYHATLPEFLTDKSTHEDAELKRFAVEPAYWHKEIVAACRAGSDAWEKVDWLQADSYGLRNLASHLYELRGCDGYSEELHKLVQTPEFVQAQIERWRNPGPTLADLRLALQTALAEDTLAQAWEHIRRYRKISQREQETGRVAARVKEGDYETGLEITSLYGHLPGSQALMRLWIAWKAAADGQPQVAAAAARRALENLPPREVVTRRLEEADPEIGGAVSDSMDALVEAFIRVMIRVTRSAAPTKTARHAWLASATGTWPETWVRAVADRLYEPLKAWGDIFAKYVDTRPMGTLLADLRDELGSADRPMNFRDTSFFYHRTLGAGLFFSRDEPLWQDHVSQTVEAIALDDYPSYREMALAWIAAAVVAHTSGERARDALLTTLSGALDKPDPGFWGDTIAAALDGWAREKGDELHPDRLVRQLEEIELKQLRKVDPTLPYKPEELRDWRQQRRLPPDPWAHDMRRRSAVAAVLHRRGRIAEAEVQLDTAAAQDQWESYAGYRALARPSLACRWLEWGRCEETPPASSWLDQCRLGRALSQLEEARKDAGHMLDKVLSQERLALLTAMAGWLSELGDPLAGPTDESAALRRLQDLLGMQRSLYLQYLSAVWYLDADRLRRLVPLALEDATATDAVLGRLAGSLDLPKTKGTPWTDLVKAMGL